MKTDFDIRYRIIKSIYEKPQTFTELLKKHFGGNSNRKSKLDYILKTTALIMKKNDGKYHIHDSFDQPKINKELSKQEKENKIYITNNPQLPPTEKAKYMMPYLEELHSQLVLYTNSLAKAKHQKLYFDKPNPKKIKWLIKYCKKSRDYYDRKMAELYAFAQKESFYGELIEYFLIKLRMGYLSIQAL